MMASGFPPQGHPGMPQGIGPGMGPGIGPNGHVMGQPMQVHGGPGPNGPHVTQGGQMMGMPPGMAPGAPNAHAMAHLGGAQAQYFAAQQQQLQMQNIQRQQQHAQQQQQMLQRQQMMNQQQGGMGIAGFPNNQHMAMQGNPQFPGGAVNLPPHFVHQIQNQTRMRQEQQAAAMHHHQQQQALQQRQQQQQAQHQQQQQQQHISMQSNPSSQGQPVSQPPQGPPAQAAQGPTRPPSQMGGPRETQPSPAPQNGPQQAPTPQPQPGQQSQGPNQPPPTPQQNSQQQGQPNQQSQAPPQAGSQQTSAPPNPQLAHPMQVTPYQQPGQQQQQVQAYAQKMQALQRQQQSQLHGPGLHSNQAFQQVNTGGLILKLILFADTLSGRSSKDTIEEWQNFVTKHFSEDGSFMYIVEHKETGKTKQYDIPAASLARFYWTHFDGEVEEINFGLDGLSETVTSNTVQCARAKLTYSFKNGTQLICNGKLSALFGPDGNMSVLRFETISSQQLIPRDKLEGLFAQDSPVQLNKQSPKLNKNAKNRNQRQQLNADPTISLADIPESPVTEYGVTKKVQAFLEVSETMSHMQLLMSHYIKNSNMSPPQALEDYVAGMLNGGAHQMQMGGQLAPGQIAMLQNQQNNLPPGSRTPSGMAGVNAGSGQYMSPAMANLGLPNALNGSPHLMQTHHTPSPAGTHNLAAQHSQQGTNSSATASANTSPNVSNKRRRASGVKLEDDGPEINGNNKVKASPRAGNNPKRVKSGA